MPQLKIFYRLVVRPLRREPLRTCLTALAVALGVGVVLAIELAGDAAAGSFRSSVETLAGDADFEVTATAGVPPAALERLASLPYALRLHPRIEDYAVLTDSGRTVPLIGVDMVGDAPEGSASVQPGSEEAGTFQRADSIWIGDELGYKAGDRVRLLINDHAGAYTVRGVLGERSGEVVVMDLAPATMALGRTGRLDRILVQTPKGKTQQEWERVVAGALPEGVTVSPAGSEDAREPPHARSLPLESPRPQLHRAGGRGLPDLQHDLGVGSAAARRDRHRARAGRDPRRACWRRSSAKRRASGLVGCAARHRSWAALMAVGAVQLVAATVESLYVSSRPAPDRAHVATCGDRRWLIGVGVAVLSALSPAWEAAQVTPVEAMARGRREHDVRMHKARDLGAGRWSWRSPRGCAARQAPVDGKPLFGYLAAVLLIAASALAIPALVAAVSSIARAACCAALFGVEALLAARSLAGSLRRTSVLVGALATAIAMMAAVGIMVGSFRETVIVWMHDRLQADLYLRPAGPSGADRFPTMSAEVADRIAALARGRRGRSLPSLSDQLPRPARDARRRRGAHHGQVRQASACSPGEDRIASSSASHKAARVIVSEPFANKHHVQAGRHGERCRSAGRHVSFRVLDVYYDYSSERGYIIMDRSTLLQVSARSGALEPGGVPRSRACRSRQGRNAGPAAGAVVGRCSSSPTDRCARRRSAIFDRTFAITYALEAVAVFVARNGDCRRAAGAGHRPPARTRAAAVSGRRARPDAAHDPVRSGAARVAGQHRRPGPRASLLSLLLIYVINKQSFGWTIQFHWPVGVLLGALSVVYWRPLARGPLPGARGDAAEPDRGGP